MRTTAESLKEERNWRWVSTALGLIILPHGHTFLERGLFCFSWENVLLDLDPVLATHASPQLSISRGVCSPAAIKSRVTKITLPPSIVFIACAFFKKDLFMLFM